MATYGKCVCGKSVSEKKDGTPRAHICNAEGGPAWAVAAGWSAQPGVSLNPEQIDSINEAAGGSAQPVVPADVDEMDSPTRELLASLPIGSFAEPTMADPLVSPNTTCTHPRGFTWGDDGIGNSGAGCPLCGAEELDSPTEELLAAIDDQPDPEENWNGTGRPRPSASTVKVPEPEPQEDKPRLLDAMVAAARGGEYVNPAAESAAIGAQQMADAFSMPTPQGSGPVRGAAPATHTGVPSMHSGAAPDPFTTPTHVAPPLGSATDQPETERDRYGRYLIKDPRTGDFKRNRSGTPEGFTRATTFAKTLIDQFGIHQWEMRSVLAGLALRPDLVARAKGLDVAADKDILNAIAAEAKDAAGGNEAADDGTEFHTVTEWLDTGRMLPKDAPEKFRAEALAYAAKMEEAGLQTRTGFIERVTFTDRGGEDVAGTADRILRERNGQLVVGDVKSGKGIDLAQREIAIQLKVYAMGINQFGLYNKVTKTWEPWTGPPVSEDYGIVMHVPVVRPEGTEAYCDLYRIDLRGVPPYEVSRAAHAAAWVREWRKQKGFLSPYHAPAAVPSPPEYNMAPMPQGNPQPAPTRTWAEAFSSVTTPEEANRLWEAAVAAGMDSATLDENVALARQALQLRG